MIGLVVFHVIAIAWVLYFQRESMATNFDGLDTEEEEEERIQLLT
jgi:hypothetical protein